MCFSATASFVASAALVGGGTAAIIRFKYSKKELCLALIPVLFGIHQFSEGLVWLGINGVVSSEIQNAAMYFFAFVAMCVWPIFIPLAILMYESPKKKRIFQLLVACGLALSLYLLYCFTIYSDLSINVKCCNSIAYIYWIPWGYNIIDGFYVFLVVLPMLLSSNPRIRYILGPGFFITFLIALFIQSGQDYPSIWCFLAAALSILNYYALARPKEAPETKGLNTLKGPQT